jgi:hypothetical protein
VCDLRTKKNAHDVGVVSLQLPCSFEGLEEPNEVPVVKRTGTLMRPKGELNLESSDE